MSAAERFTTDRSSQSGPDYTKLRMMLQGRIPYSQTLDYIPPSLRSLSRI